MVLVKAKRDELLAPLSAVSGIIERRHTLPILSNVLIERSGGRARLSRHRHRDPDRGAQRDRGLPARRARSRSARASCWTSCARCPRAPRSPCSSRTSGCRSRRARAASRCRPCRRRIFRASRSRPATSAQASSCSRKPCAALLGAGAVRDGAAGHPLLPERPADGGRGRQPQAGRDRRPSPGVTPRSSSAAELPRQEVIVPRKTVLELTKLLADNDEPVKHRAFGDPGGVQLRHRRAGLQAGRRQISGLHAGHPDAAQEPAAASSARRCARRCSARRSCPTKSSAACAGCWPTAA